MHDPDEEPGKPEESWDQWFGRTYGSRGSMRWRVLFAAISVAVISLYWIDVARGS